jgi:hypothetical protein
MPKCEQCGKEVELPFECKFCKGYFCIEHRLPESHDCPNAPPRTPLGSYQSKQVLASTAKKKETEIVKRSISETKTYDNIFGHHFNVPIEVYSDEKYREKLNRARTLNDVEHILHDYYKHHRKP